MTDHIQYPRNQLVRKSFQAIGKTLLALLTKTTITGMEHYPTSGKLIVVGNHTGLLETVLMTSHAPRTIEFMASVDIPHERIFYAILNMYKFIPVFRGNVSPSAMKEGLNVLEQDGVIGIFPEGGIWEPAIRSAHAGVAWMSYHAQAPVLPIGFSATKGAVGDTLRLKHPKLHMHIGEPLPAVHLNKGTPKKQQFQDAAQNIMDAVWKLIPEEDRQPHEDIVDERFELEIKVFDQDKNKVDIPPHLIPENGHAFSKILYRTTLINNFRDNLHINIQPLKTLHLSPSPAALAQSTGEILHYLDTENPYYFTYRYGLHEGSRMQTSLREFHNLAVWAKEQGHTLKATVRRLYRMAGQDEEIIENQPNEMKKW